MYLIRCYPGDDEVASIVVLLIERFGRHISLHEEEIWDELYSGFRGHARISSAVRTMLRQHWEKYELIFWDRQTASSMTVLGDEGARDEL